MLSVIKTCLCNVLSRPTYIIAQSVGVSPELGQSAAAMYMDVNKSHVHAAGHCLPNCTALVFCHNNRSLLSQVTSKRFTGMGMCAGQLYLSHVNQVASKVVDIRVQPERHRFPCQQVFSSPLCNGLGSTWPYDVSQQQARQLCHTQQCHEIQAGMHATLSSFWSSLAGNKAMSESSTLGHNAGGAAWKQIA